MIDARATVAVRHPTVFGEGPVWDARDATVWWVDMDGRELLGWSRREDRLRRFALERAPSALVPAASGGFLVLSGRRCSRWRPGGTPQVYLELDDAEDDVGFNDAKCDPRGRLWVGTVAEDRRAGAGALYRIAAGRAERMLDGITLSNGLGWSPDARTMYFVDTLTHRVDAFDFDAGRGRIDRRRSFHRVDPDDGLPDGLSVDAHGVVWLALWGAGEVRAIAPDGRVLGAVRLGVRSSTSCTFGGGDLQTLFVTTAGVGSGLPAAPDAGGLFATRVPVAGQPVPLYACHA